MNLPKRFFAFQLLYILFIGCGYSQVKNDWVLSKSKNGIKIYTRHSSDSPIKIVKGIVEIETNLSALVALVKDANNQHNWVYLTKTARLLKQPNSFEWFYYNQSDAPWPVTNRDIVSHAKMTQNSDTYAIRINTIGLPDYIPRKDDVVWIPGLKSSWSFIPATEGVVFVEFQLFIDLGGRLPAWVVNMAIDTGPYNTLWGMSQQVKKDAYKNAKLPYIKEKTWDK